MEKKKNKWLKVTFITLFIIYISLYALNVSGYYDTKIKRKVEFTESQIEEFEKDIANGEAVDVKDYLTDMNKDYTNNISKFGYNFSKSIDNFLNKGIKEFIRFLGKLLS